MNDRHTRQPHTVGLRAGAAVTMALVALMALVAAPRDAAAHAAYQRSDPAANSVVASSPAEITVWFTEPLEMEFSSATLYDQRGEAVPGGTSGPGPDEFSLTIPVPGALPNGTYSVAFVSLSAADGHGDRSYFAFTVGTAADVTAVVAPNAGAAPGSLWAQTLGRWLALVGLVGAVAVWPIWVVVLRPSLGGIGSGGARLAGRARRLAWGAVGLAVAGNLAALLAQADQLPSGGLPSRLRETLTDTRYGELWGLRIGLLALFAGTLLLVSWEEPGRTGWRTALALGAAALLPLPISLNAHASAVGDGRTAAIATDLTHVVAASLWAGGIAILLLAAAVGLRGAEPVARRAALGRALPRFSALALVAWAVLLVTGLYNAWLHVGSLDGLRETDYGRSLTVKLLLLAPILALAALNLLVVSRRVGRADPGVGGAWARRFAAALSAEVVLALLVLLVVGRLTSQQPARDALVGETVAVELPVALSDRSGTLALSPGTAGPNDFRLTVDGEMLPADTEAVLRIELPASALTRKEIRLERGEGNTFQATGSELSTTGDWTIEVLVRKIGAFQYTGTVPYAVGLTPRTVDGPGPAWRFETSAIAGLAFLIAGLGGWAVGWRAGGRPLRREAVGLGTVLVGMGVLVILASRAPDPDGTLAAGNSLPADEASLARGEASFLTNCASCHGAAGRGDGPAGAGMDPPPADLTAHGGMHDDEALFAWIADGIDGSAMPAFGDTLGDDEIWDIVNYIRSLQSSTAAGGTTIASAECTVAPRTLASLDDASTAATIAAVMRGVVACKNAGDNGRVFAYYSDAYLLREMAQLSEPDRASFATYVAEPAAPLPEASWAALVAVGDVQLLSDGRVAATVTVNDPSGHPHENTDVIVFVQEGQRWAIDEIRG